MPRASRKRYLSLRDAYQPQNLRLIIIAESPPASGRYFYDATGSIGEPLFKAMMQAIGFRSSTKEEGLREFQRQGWLLSDATYEPVNDLSNSERDAMIARDFDLLCEDLQAITPDRRTPIVLIKKNVCRILNPRLSRRGFTVLNAGRSVYFPSHGRQTQFKQQFSEILTQFAIFPIPPKKPLRSKSELTMQEDIALGLAFEYVGENRYNRTSDEYADIAARLPPIKVLHGYVNDRLKEIAKSGEGPLGLCYFQAGDQKAWTAPYPQSLSLEVVRSALVKSGMRHKQVRKSRTR